MTTTGHSPQDFSVKAGKRTARACDECRRLKIRCEFPETDSTTSDRPKRCRGCFASAIDCTFTAPVHKRGPPKGYLSALEQRLNDAEALLGVLICSKDPRAASLIADLSKDPLASSIIHRVSKSEFGPTGRAERHQSSVSRQFKQSESPIFSIDHNGHLVFTSPSNTWQDYLDMRLILESRSRSNHALQREMQGVSLSSPTSDSTTMHQTPTFDSPEITEANLKNLHARLCEEINSWLSSDETNTYHSSAVSDQFITSTDPYSVSSSHNDFMISASNEGRFHDTSGSQPHISEQQRSHEQPFQSQYGALCDVLGLDRKEWGI